LLPLRLKDRLFHGWVIVVAFFIFGTTVMGIRLSFGVFFKSIENEFNLSRAATSTVVSLSTILGIAFAILGGWALDRYGPRIIVFLMGLATGTSLLLTGQTNAAWQLFLTYSLLLAMGTSTTYVVMMSTIMRWFDRKQGLALGIASSGMGLGMVVMAPFATFLISKFDWRMAYVILGFIAWSIILPLAMIIKHPNERRALSIKAESVSVGTEKQQFAVGTISSQMAGLSLLQALRTRSFWLIMFIWVFYASNSLLVLTHLVPHTTDMGFSAAEAATVISLIGGITIAGRVLMGTLSDRVTSKATAIVCSLLLAGAMAWLVWAQDLWNLTLTPLSLFHMSEPYCRPVRELVNAPK